MRKKRKPKLKNSIIDIELDDEFDNPDELITFGNGLDEINGNVYICKKILLESQTELFLNKTGVLNSITIPFNELRYGKESNEQIIARLSHLSYKRFFGIAVVNEENVCITILNRELLSKSIDFAVDNFIGDSFNIHYEFLKPKTHANFYPSRTQYDIFHSFIKQLYRKYKNGLLTIHSKDIEENIDKLFALLTCEYLGLFTVFRIYTDTAAPFEFIANIKLSELYLERIDQEIDSGVLIKQHLSDLDYDDDNAIISHKKLKCQLVPSTKEHYLCRAMFSVQKHELISWDIVYKHLVGFREDDNIPFSEISKHWRSIYDAMLRVNNKIKLTLNTDDNFLSRINRSIKRNF